MPRYSATSGKSPEEVIEAARRFFGEGGVGLAVSEEDPCCITLEGGGGYVSVAASKEETTTEVELVTREWDYQVKEFMQRV